MTFECEIDRVHFRITLLPDLKYRPGLRDAMPPKEEMKALEQNELGWFNLQIVSSFQGASFTHLCPALLLPNDASTWHGEVESYMHRRRIFESILQAWIQAGVNPGPAWRKD